MRDEQLKRYLLRFHTEEQIEQALSSFVEAHSRTEEEEKQALLRLLAAHLEAHPDDDACRSCLLALRVKESRYFTSRDVGTRWLRELYYLRSKRPGWSQTPGFAGLLEGLNQAEELLTTLHFFGAEEERECLAFTNLDVSQLIGVLVDWRSPQQAA